MLLACLISMAIAITSYKIGTHLSEEAEGITVLALLTCLGCLVMCLVFLPMVLKGMLLVGLLATRGYESIASNQP